MILLDKSYKLEDKNTKIKVCIAYDENMNIRQEDKENRLSYFDNLLSNVNSSVNLANVILWIKSIFRDYNLTFFNIILNTANLHSTVAFDQDKLVNFSYIIKENNQEILRIENDNYNINTKINRKYYQNNSNYSHVNLKIKSILKDFLKMQEIQYTTLKDFFDIQEVSYIPLHNKRNLIEIYNSFYNEVPNFSLASTEQKMQNMMFIIESCGFYYDYQYSIKEEEKLVYSQELQNDIEILKSYYVDDIDEYLRNKETVINNDISFIGKNIRKHIDNLPENEQVEFLNTLIFNIRSSRNGHITPQEEPYNGLIKQLSKKYKLNF